MMNIIVNDRSYCFHEEEMTVETLLKNLKKSTHGTAVAVNGMLVRKDNWKTSVIKDADVVTIISAAFGG